MKLRRRLLRVVEPDRGGARKLSVLRGLAAAKHPDEDFDAVFAALLREGALVKLGDKRGATYGLPGGRR